MIEKISNIIENNYKHSTNKEDTINIVIMCILTFLSLIPLYFLNIYVGVILTLYCVIIILSIIFDLFELPDNQYLSFIIFLPFICPMLVESYIFKLITPYRGNDLNKIRKYKLRKIKRCSIFK